MRDHHINIFYSEEDGGYIADIPDLPLCTAFGEGPQEALAEVLKAKAAWIEAAKAEGKPFPSPSFKPVIYRLSEARTSLRGSQTEETPSRGHPRRKRGADLFCRSAALAHDR